MRIPSIALAACLAALACNDSSTGPAGEGELQVTLRTIGGDPDLDGYVLDVDGRVALPMGPNGGTTLRLSAGRHVLELEGVAPNCAVEGGRRHEIDVPAGRMVVAIAVACEATGVRITVATTGLDPDADGYRVLVNGTHRATMAASTTTTVSRLEPGTHLVELAGVAGNCELAGAATQSVTIANREVVPLGFAASCVATSGVIRVEVSTTGSDRDADGYLALLDGQGTISAPIAGASGVGHLTTVPAGTHSVSLDGVAANCAVVGEAVATAVVTVGAPVRDTVEVGFTVDCVLDSGTIHVSTTVTGDPQGTHFTVHPSCDWYYASCPDPIPAPVPLAPDGSATLTVRSGELDLYLTPSSPTCLVTSGQGTRVVIARGSEHEVHFEVGCGPITLRVSAPTTGTNPDTEYAATLWYYDWWYYWPVAIELGVLAADATLTAQAPFPGTYWVSLGGVAANCVVQVANPTAEFLLQPGDTREVVFPVSCGP